MISVNDLSFGYPKKELLFKNMELQIPVGNIYGLLGKNGAGKTSLLKILSGLRYPSAGHCDVMDYRPEKRQADFLQNIFILPEEFSVPSLKIGKFEKMYAPFYPEFNSEQFKRYLQEFELSYEANLPALSMGQQKKFLIAFGLATNCRLLLLDELTNGLDIPSKGQFRKMLAAITNEDNLIFISTHQVRDVENLIDSIIVLDDGKIIFYQSMYAVSEQLCFKMQTEKPNKDVFYSEETHGGYLVIKKNTNENETIFQLETLFNAIITNYENINSVFEKEVSCEK